MVSQEDKIFAGQLFWPNDPELVAMKRRAHSLSLEYGSVPEHMTQRRRELAERILARYGRDSYMQGPVFFHYGKHTIIGDYCFINYNFTVQDDARVSIGDHCDIGPNVTIVTPVHPMLACERISLLCADGQRRRLCYAKPVNIGAGCWICAGATILPGVNIGEGCVIGAGSVVTRDIPEGTFAAGNPCRVIRRLGPADSMACRPDILADNLIAEDGAEP